MADQNDGRGLRLRVAFYILVAGLLMVSGQAVILGINKFPGQIFAPPLADGVQFAPPSLNSLLERPKKRQLLINGISFSPGDFQKFRGQGIVAKSSNVMNVEDAVFELFVEDAWLDLKGCLGGFEGFAEGDEAGGGPRREIERVEQAES